MKKLLTLFLCIAVCANSMAQCLPIAYSVLDVNNVTAPVDNDGSIGFLDGLNLNYTIDTGNGNAAAYLAAGLWVGGLDQNNELRLAAMRYGQNGYDYFPGPLNTTNAQADPLVCAEYNRMWTLDRWKVEEFVARFNQHPGYIIPAEILEWPAHGDVSQGLDYNMAPYYDADGSGDYDPEEGDYPLYDLNPLPTANSNTFKLEGDQSTWWVMNDAAYNHVESGGEPIGLEIRCVAYALDGCNALANTTFYRYQLINRGSHTLHNTYIGLWVDADAGFSQDDYAQCDVTRNMGFVYDGLFGAGNGTAFGIDFLQGPYEDSNGQDDDNNGVVDDETIEMSKFVTGGMVQDPSMPIHYYNTLQGLWADGTPMCYGGNGHQSTPGCTDNAHYMFPADSDPMGVGTGGIPQMEWTEQTAGNLVGERRFLMSAGPFTLEPGAIHNLHYAVVWANDASGQLPIEALEEADDEVQAAFDANFANLSCCPPKAQIHVAQPSANEFLFSSVTKAEEYFWDFGDGTTSTNRFPYTHSFSDNLMHEVMLVVSNSCGSDTAYIDAGSLTFSIDKNQTSSFTIFPNPTANEFTISFNQQGMQGMLEVKNLLGQTIYSQQVNRKERITMAANWPVGNYVVLFRTNNALSVERLSVVR